MQRRIICQSIIASFLLVFLLINCDAALAHKGHAGPPKIFMDEEEALKTMLPEGGKVVRRKEELKKEKYNEAVKQWGYSPDAGIYSYFISKGKEGELSGVLFIRSVEYKHGGIGLAVSYDRKGELTGLKILSSPEKYVEEIKENIQSNGFLDKFLHLTTEKVIALGKSFNQEPSESLQHIFAGEIGGTAILLKIFQGL